ncbi:MAG TPA: hypothetical protein VFD27_11140 [Chthoniobacteraceae bacterium]|nr:hypothetical protein [Chthoniobacteraceae bacterium]
MADTPVIYKPLRGRGSSVIARTRLWEGPDHLLFVTSWPTGEGYRRFFFRDIQALVIRNTSRRMWVNIILFVLAAITVGPILAFSDRGSASLTAAGIVGGFWLLLVLLNSLLGPTCETHIQTAIQTERISSLGRLRTAQKVLARIQPRILAAQSESETATLQPIA